MRPKLLRFGESQSPVVVIDDFSGAYDSIVDIAVRLAPFPRAENYYPGLRRLISEADREANAYVEYAMQAAGPFIGGAFDFSQFELIEAGFSIVTAAPDELVPVQRAPHFDTVDADQLALLHYLSAAPNTGTAFFRHRATGIEVVDPSNAEAFVA